MTSEFFAWPALGVLMALIFLLDGWRTFTGRSNDLRHSPKVRSLLYLLGGATLPSIRTLLDPGPQALTTYAATFVFTTLVLFGVNVRLRPGGDDCHLRHLNAGGGPYPAARRRQ